MYYLLQYTPHYLILLKNQEQKWATVNKEDGGGKKSGSGRGKKD